MINVQKTRIAIMFKSGNLSPQIQNALRILSMINKTKYISRAITEKLQNTKRKKKRYYQQSKEKRQWLTKEWWLAALLTQWKPEDGEIISSKYWKKITAIPNSMYPAKCHSRT